MSNHRHLAALLGIAATAAIYLTVGTLLGTDNLLGKVVYGIGMCVSARLAGGMIHRALARRASKDQ